MNFESYPDDLSQQDIASKFWIQTLQNFSSKHTVDLEKCTKE
jgi:hypothetical protein